VKLRSCLRVATMCGMLLVCRLATLEADSYDVLTEPQVAVKMRDGVVLRANVFRPKAEGRFPVLLERTPYNKEGESKFPAKAAARGYVVVIQDCRGRFASQGEWTPFKNEAQDGYDTIEWAARLPYSNGKVGLIGSSYMGATQMLAAVSQPPHLAGLLPEFTASDYHDGWVYQGGAFELWFNLTWTGRHLAADTLKRWYEKHTNIEDSVGKLPLSGYSLPGLELTEAVLAPYYREWIDHPSYDSFWKQLSIEERYDRIDVPAYHTGGWYDIFLRGTLRNYIGIETKGGSESARHGQHLLIGPWAHGPYGGKSSPLSFGLPTGYYAWEGREELLFRWYDHVLKGVDNGIEHDKPVKIFVMGENQWREEDSWPLARARTTPYYLNSGGRANTEGGDGILLTSLPQDSPPDRFIYDPADPVPTVGGALCCAGDFVAGAFDQNPVEKRVDVLVYSTPAFTENVEVTGPITLDLYVSSTARDTDFTGKLVDVWPNGFAQNLADGILRARYRNSRQEPELLELGRVYEVTVDLGATSNVFLKGHRLRLEVSSSNFPRFDRNLNTGEDAGKTSQWLKSTNTIYHDRRRPSALVLPIEPR